MPDYAVVFRLTSWDAIVFSFHITCNQSAHRFECQPHIRHTVQLSSKIILPASPSPPSPAGTTPALRLVAICASICLYS